MKKTAPSKINKFPLKGFQKTKAFSIFNFNREPYRTEIWSVYHSFNGKNGRFLVRYGSRFLERYGSRYKIHTKNGNELCTVRFALFNEKTFARVR